MPEALAVVRGAVNVDALPLHKHHINMVKYDSADDLAFQMVLTHIKLMSQVATMEVHASWEQEFKRRS